MTALEKQITELDERKQKEEESLREGSWRQLKATARDAPARNAAWAFWREGFFWMGTLLFVLGLIPLAFSGQGPVRWACLIMLIVIVLRLYLLRA